MNIKGNGKKLNKKQNPSNRRVLSKVKGLLLHQTFYGLLSLAWICTRYTKRQVRTRHRTPYPCCSGRWSEPACRSRRRSRHGQQDAGGVGDVHGASGRVRIDQTPLSRLLWSTPSTLSTVSSKVQRDSLPYSSSAQRVMVYTPSGTSVPAAGSCENTVTGSVQLSVAVACPSPQ